MSQIGVLGVGTMNRLLLAHTLIASIRKSIPSGDTAGEIPRFDGTTGVLREN
jgi:hypothetical protein